MTVEEPTACTHRSICFQTGPAPTAIIDRRVKGNRLNPNQNEQPADFEPRKGEQTPVGSWLKGIFRIPTGRTRRESVRSDAELRNASVWGIQRCVNDFSHPYLLHQLMPQILARFDASNLLIGLYGSVEHIADIPGKLAGAYFTNRTKNRARLAATFISISFWPALLPIGVLFAYRAEPHFMPFYVAALAALAVGMVFEWTGYVCHADLLSRITVPSRRGLITGWGTTIAGGTRMAGGLILAMILYQSFPMNFVVASLIGLVVSVIGAWIIVFSRELPGLRSPPVEERGSIIKAVKLVSSDRRYVLFLSAALLKFGFYAGQTFVIVQAFKNPHLKLGDEWGGFFASMWAGITIVQAPIAGFLADRFGRGLTGLVGGVLCLVGMVWYAHITNIPELIATYILMWLGFDVISRSIYLATIELSPKAGRGAFVASRYIVESCGGIVFRPIVGLAMDHFGPQYIFYICAASGLLTGYILYRAIPIESLQEQ